MGHFYHSFVLGLCVGRASSPANRDKLLSFDHLGMFEFGHPGARQDFK